MNADQPIFSNSFPKNSLLGSIPVREDVLFANYKGEEKAGIRERAKERIRKLEPALQKLLARDEVVLYTAAASAHFGKERRLSRIRRRCGMFMSWREE